MVVKKVMNFCYIDIGFYGSFYIGLGNNRFGEVDRDNDCFVLCVGNADSTNRFFL